MFDSGLTTKPNCSTIHNSDAHTYKGTTAISQALSLSMRRLFGTDTPKQCFTPGTVKFNCAPAFFITHER